MTHVRLGVVGAGSIALRGILPHLTQADVQHRVQVTAVCDPVPGRAQAAAERFGVPHAFLDFDDLLERSEVDAVSICSPIGLHFEQGLRALEAGKHVHFNKTMATTLAECNALIGAAAQRDLKIVASPGQMLFPHNRRMRELIAEGAIGRLCWAAAGVALGTYHEDESVRHGSDVLSNIDPSWYFRKPGGGPLFDVVVYPLHALTGILGPARRAAALSGLRLPERPFAGRMVPCDADDTTLLLLDFGEALFAFVYGTVKGSVSSGFTPSFFGTEGTVAGTTINGRPFDYPGREEADVATDGLGNHRLLPHVTGSHRDLEEMHVFEDVMQLVDWIIDGTPSIVTAEHARHVVEIIEAGYRAAETGETQPLTSTFVPG
jgi:predicted dehydrogenase